MMWAPLIHRQKTREKLCTSYRIEEFIELEMSTLNVEFVGPINYNSQLRSSCLVFHVKAFHSIPFPQLFVNLDIAVAKFVCTMYVYLAKL